MTMSTYTKYLAIRDTGVINGIELPVFLAIVCFALVFVCEKNSLTCGLEATLLLTGLNILPSLKYQLLYGTVDPLYHLALTNRVVILGQVPFGYDYTGSPLMHILHAQFSLLTGASLLESIKYLLPMIMGLTPLFFFMLGSTTFKDENQRKYAILSSLILYSNYNYSLTAATLAVFFSLGLLLNFFGHEVKFAVIGLIFAMGIITSHHFSAFILTIIMILYSLLVLLQDAIIKIRRYSAEPRTMDLTKAHFTALFSIMVLTWYIYESDWVLDKFIRIVSNALTGISEFSAPLVGVGLRTMQFEIWFRILISANIGKAIILVTGIFGLALVLKRLMCRPSEIKVVLLIPALNRAVIYVSACAIIYLALFVASNTPGFPSLKPERLMWYTFPIVAVFFSSYFMYYLLEDRVMTIMRSRNLTNIFIFCFIVVLVSSTLVEFFPSEQILPISNWYNHVNSIYQYKEARWLAVYSESMRVASDRITSLQLKAFTDANYQMLSSYESSLFLRLYFLHMDGGLRLGKDVVFASHYPGKAGVLGEDLRLENRTLVSETLERSQIDIIYYNGESFVVCLP